MKFAKSLSLACMVATFGPILALAANHFPEEMLRNIECLKRHGLIQGTVTDVRSGEAHFAPFFRETNIGALRPTMRYNKDFVEGRLKVSPDIIKICRPGTTLRKHKY